MGRPETNLSIEYKQKEKNIFLSDRRTFSHISKVDILNPV